MDRPISYLALGDSYTIGESVAEADRWPDLLTGSVREAGGNMDTPRIVARTGWATGELIEAIQAESIEEQFDLVSLLIGVNNQYRGWDVKQFRVEFSSLLDLSVKFAGGEPAGVVVLSIPDWGRTPFAKGRNHVDITKEIDRFNLVKKTISTKRGIDFVEITEMTRRYGKDAAYLANDGLHYSAEMHRIWAEAVLESKSKRLFKK